METFNLAEYNQRYPFNNFAKLFHAVGEKFPSEQLGGNCIWHAHMLTQFLKKDGYKDIAYARANGGEHIIVFAKKNGRTFLFDRSLEMLEPICLDKLECKDRITNVEAYPIVDGRPSLVDAYYSANIEDPNADRELYLVNEKRVFDHGAYSTDKFYTYSEPVGKIPSIDDLSIALTHSRKALFYLFCEDSNGTRRSIVYNCHEENFYIKVDGGNAGRLKIYESNKFSGRYSPFEIQLTQISKQVEIPPAILKNYMQRAYSILNYLRRDLRRAVNLF